MPKCSDCGFNEEEPSQVLTEPYTGRTVGISESLAVCTFDLGKPTKISNPFVERECRNFKQKRKGWSTKEFHELKDRYITNRRTFWISITAVIISLVSLVSGTFLPNVFKAPDVELTFQLIPPSTSLGINMTAPLDFVVYNAGNENCFIISAWVNEILENQTKVPFISVDSLWNTQLDAGQTVKVHLELSNPTEMPQIRQFDIEVRYEPNTRTISRPFWISWR